MAAYVTKWCVFIYKPVLLLQRRSLVGANSSSLVLQENSNS